MESGSGCGVAAPVRRLPCSHLQSRVDRSARTSAPWVRQDHPRPLPPHIGTSRCHLERNAGSGRPRRTSPSSGQMPISSNPLTEGRKGRAAACEGFLPTKPISRVIGTFDPALDASSVSSSPVVRHYASSGSRISALSRSGAWRMPGHRRLLQRDMQHGEVMKSLLGGELVAHSLNSSGQDRGDFA